MKKLLFLFLLSAGINVTAQQTKIISDANAKQRTINGTFTAVKCGYRCTALSYTGK